jgi:hypothetical protein
VTEHEALEAVFPLGSELGKASGACSPGKGEWCSGARLAVRSGKITAGTMNTSGANFSPVLVLKGRDGLRLRFCGWCGQSLILEERLAQTVDVLKLGEEKARFWFERARTEAFRATSEAATVAAGKPGDLAATLAECKAWELAGRHAATLQEVYRVLGEALDKEPRP